MTIGLVGKKKGMTRIFTEDGAATPVTVIEVTPNRVVRVKTDSSDGYSSVQVTTGTVKASRINKPDAGTFRTAGVEAGRGLWEFAADSSELEGLDSSSVLDVTHFAEVGKVDVQGVSIGKGFAGVIKRHNFHMQDATHGNSLAHRAPGSIGQNQTPGRVFKGKKMAGHMGNCNVTQQSLELVKIDQERNLLLVKGSVPGPAGGDVIIRPAVKTRGK